jgi:hypothetical protein
MDEALATAERPVGSWAVWHFRLAALLNVTTCIPNAVFPNLMAVVLGVAPLNHPYFLRAFAGLGVVFGGLYYEISRDPLRNRNLIKYGWIAKAVSFTAVSYDFLMGQGSHLAIWLFFVVEDFVWIPSFIYYDLRMRALAASGQARG